MDVRSLRNGHEGQVLRHVVTTREGWSRSAFDRYGYMYFIFSTRGDSCADYQAAVDTRNGKIRARWQSYDPLGCGEHDDSGGFSDFYARLEWEKPRDDRFVLKVPIDLLELPRRRRPVSLVSHHHMDPLRSVRRHGSGSRQPQRAFHSSAVGDRWLRPVLLLSGSARLRSSRSAFDPLPRPQRRRPARRPTYFEVARYVNRVGVSAANRHTIATGKPFGTRPRSTVSPPRFLSKTRRSGRAEGSVTSPRDS